MTREIPQKLRRHGIYIIRIGPAPDYVAAYIGSTLKSFNERWKRHLRKLETKVHPNSDLQAFYDEDPASLHFDILESMRTRDKIKIETTERRWFELLKPHITIINHQTPRVGKTSKRGRGLRRRRKARVEAARLRQARVQVGAAAELRRLTTDD